MDAVGISCTSSSTVKTTMMRSRSNDVIWRDISDRRQAGKTRSAIPSLCARPTRNLDAIVFSAGASSSGKEVKATFLYVVDRTAIEASLMPKGDMERPNDEREDPRHEWSKMKHVCCREIQPRGGPQGTGRGAGRVARSRWCVKWTLQLDRGIVGMRPATSFSIGTSLRTPMGQISWAVRVLCQMLQQTTTRLWCITRRTVKQPVRTRLKQAWSLYFWQCGQVESLCASSNDIIKTRRELRHGAEHDSAEQHGCGYLVWTLGVGMADGPRVLTWEVPCAPVVAADTGGWSAIVVWRNDRADVYDGGLLRRCRKSVSCARNKTWPGKSKVRESRWWLRERRRKHSNPLTHWRCLSVSFIAEADVRNVEHQIDMIQRGRRDHEERCRPRANESEELRASFNPARGSSVDAKSVLRNVPETIGLTSQPTREEVRTSRRCQYRNHESQSCRLCLFLF